MPDSKIYFCEKDRVVYDSSRDEATYGPQQCPCCGEEMRVITEEEYAIIKSGAPLHEQASQAQQMDQCNQASGEGHRSVGGDVQGVRGQDSKTTRLCDGTREPADSQGGFIAGYWRSGKRRYCLDFRTLQEQQDEWSKKNFPDQKSHECLLGVVEECGELEVTDTETPKGFLIEALGRLAHAHLKNEQGIRMNEKHYEAKCDAIGDIVIYLAGYCNANKIDLQECVEAAWNEVKQRDWRKK